MKKSHNQYEMGKKSQYIHIFILDDKKSTRKATRFKKDRPEAPIRSQGTSLKGNYVQKGMALRAKILKRDYSMVNNGPKGHYVQKGPAQWVTTLKKGPAQRAKTFKRSRPKRPYVQKGPA
jgi:hypothetical protein